MMDIIQLVNGKGGGLRHSQQHFTYRVYRGCQVLLVKEIGVPGENHRPVAHH